MMKSTAVGQFCGMICAFHLFAPPVFAGGMGEVTIAPDVVVVQKDKVVPLQTQNVEASRQSDQETNTGRTVAEIGCASGLLFREGKRVTSPCAGR